MRLIIGLFIGALGVYVGGVTAVIAASHTMLKFVPQEVIYQEDISYSDGQALFPSYQVQSAIGLQ